MEIARYCALADPSSADVYFSHTMFDFGRSAVSQAKTTKKIVLRLQCNVCKAVHMHAIKVRPGAPGYLGVLGHSLSVHATEWHSETERSL